MKWEMAKAEDGSEELFKFLDDGWEPFSITPMMKVSPFNPNQGIPVALIWLKRVAEAESSENPTRDSESAVRNEAKPHILRCDNIR